MGVTRTGSFKVAVTTSLRAFKESIAMQRRSKIEFCEREWVREVDGLRIYTEYIGPTAAYLKLCWYIADVAHRQDILTTGIHLAEKGYIIDKGPKIGRAHI